MNHLRTIFLGIFFMNPQSAFLSLALFGIFDRLDVFNGDAHQFRILRAVESPIGMNAVEIAGVISMILFWLVLLPLLMQLLPYRLFSLV